MLSAAIVPLCFYAAAWLCFILMLGEVQDSLGSMRALGWLLCSVWSLLFAVVTLFA